MIFRDFVEVTRDALQTVAFEIEGERDITPMLHLESTVGIEIVGVDPEFFDSSRSVQTLVSRYVLPRIAESGAQKVAWSYCAWAAPEHGSPTGRPGDHPDRREILLASFIDPEVVEHWAAPIIRTGGPVLIGNWMPSVPNVGGGPLITTIQQALR